MNPSIDRIRESGGGREELSLVGDNAMERLKSGSTFREREGGIDFDDGMVIGKGMEGLNDQATKPSFDVYITDGPHSDPTARIKDMEQVELFLATSKLRLHQGKHIGPTCSISNSVV